MDRFSRFFLLWMVCVVLAGVWGCGASQADQRRAWHDSIVGVLTQDWHAREDAWTSVGTSEKLEKIDLSGCPEDFQMVYRAYQDAWKTKGELVKKAATKGAVIGAAVGALCGPVVGVAGIVSGGAVGGAAGGAWSDEQKEALAQIEESWQRVATVAANYDVDAKALYARLQEQSEKR
jgi:hypothetical protein